MTTGGSFEKHLLTCLVVLKEAKWPSEAMNSTIIGTTEICGKMGIMAIRIE